MHSASTASASGRETGSPKFQDVGGAHPGPGVLILASSQSGAKPPHSKTWWSWQVRCVTTRQVVRKGQKFRNARRCGTARQRRGVRALLRRFELNVEEEVVLADDSDLKRLTSRF